MSKEKTVKIVAGSRNIFTSAGKVLAGEVSKDIPAAEAKAIISGGLAKPAEE